MAWGRIEWKLYECKHCPKKNLDWSVQVAGTMDKRSPAKYAPWVNIRWLEESVVEHRIVDGVLVLTRGRPVFCDSFQGVYLICDQIIGASNGKETDIVRVQWKENSGELHGRPYTEDELLGEMRRKGNDEEIAFYREWREGLKRG